MPAKNRVLGEVLGEVLALCVSSRNKKDERFPEHFPEHPISGRHLSEHSPEKETAAIQVVVFVHALD